MKNTTTINADPTTFEKAVSAIKKQRPDIKIGALFEYEGFWHAVHDDGPDTTRLIVVKVGLDGKVVGVNPIGEEIDQNKFFDALANEAFDVDGKPIRQEGPMTPSQEYNSETH